MEASNYIDFSLKLYALDGVADYCVRVQDDFDVDINLLLFLLWLAQQNISIDSDVIGKIVQSGSGFRQDILVPFRVLRKKLANTDAPGLKQEALGIELQMEFKMMREIFDAWIACDLQHAKAENAAIPHGSVCAVQHNLCAYKQILANSACEFDYHWLKTCMKLMS